MSVSLAPTLGKNKDFFAVCGGIVKVVETCVC